MELFWAVVRMHGMGEVRAKLRIENYGDTVLAKKGHIAFEDARVQEVDAVVDTGAVMTMLPRELVEALGLEVIDTVTVTLADERKVQMEKAGGLWMTVCGRRMLGDCLVGPAGSEPLLGQIVIEELDLVIEPRRRTLSVNPSSPDMPTMKMKSMATCFETSRGVWNYWKKPSTKLSISSGIASA